MINTNKVSVVKSRVSKLIFKKRINLFGIYHYLLKATIYVAEVKNQLLQALSLVQPSASGHLIVSAKTLSKDHLFLSSSVDLNS